MSVSAIYQHESATGIPMSSSSWTSSPPPTPSHLDERLSQSPGLSSLSNTATSHWLPILQMVMYMFHATLSIRPPLYVPSPCIHSLFSMSVSPLKRKVLVTQSCPILCNPMDCSPTGFSVHGIFQVRILEWVAILFSRGSSLPRDRTQVSHNVGRFFTIWAAKEATNGSLHCCPANMFISTTILDSKYMH